MTWAPRDHLTIIVRFSSVEVEQADAGPSLGREARGRYVTPVR
jgi:hypothetical protein